jgi:glyoxylase I family protein
MAINPAPGVIHHIALRCTDSKRTKDFYQNILGLPLVLDTPDLFGFMIANVFLGFKMASPQSENVFNPFNIGLDHIAIACEKESDLHEFAKQLQEAGIENTGVKTDETLQKLYVAFKDPDRIQWEYYMV